jgi:hypothetical protein
MASCCPWEGRYDDARPVLQDVLTQAPKYADARVALINVEYWSGRSSQARELADEILVTDPGNAQARVVRERLALRPWETPRTRSTHSTTAPIRGVTPPSR